MAKRDETQEGEHRLRNVLSRVRDCGRKWSGAVRETEGWRRRAVPVRWSNVIPNESGHLAWSRAPRNPSANSSRTWCLPFRVLSRPLPLLVDRPLLRGGLRALAASLWTRLLQRVLHQRRAVRIGDLVVRVRLRWGELQRLSASGHGVQHRGLRAAHVQYRRRLGGRVCRRLGRRHRGRFGGWIGGRHRGWIGGGLCRWFRWWLGRRFRWRIGRRLRGGLGRRVGRRCFESMRRRTDHRQRGVRRSALEWGELRVAWAGRGRSAVRLELPHVR